MSEKQEVFIARLPNVFGHGLMCVVVLPCRAIEALRISYYKARTRSGLKKGVCDWWTFQEAMVYFCGDCHPYRLGYTYTEDGILERVAGVV